MTALVFRPVTDRDLPFLAELYASTRADELAQVPWSEDEKAAFLQQQFEAQHRHYAEHFRQARFDLVLEGGAPIGRLYVDRRPDEVRVVDIALLPEHRGRGLGSAMLRDLLDEARAAGLPVRIHVEQFNPAMRLYLRLGFRLVHDQGVYHLMEWRADGAAAAEDPQAKTAS